MFCAAEYSKSEVLPPALAMIVNPFTASAGLAKAACPCKVQATRDDAAAILGNRPFHFEHRCSLSSRIL